MGIVKLTIKLMISAGNTHIIIAIFPHSKHNTRRTTVNTKKSRGLLYVAIREEVIDE
jgi:hypothetical protein